MEHTNKCDDQMFGPISIRAADIFSVSPSAFAFVNLKPIVPGHVLISPRRHDVKRFADLSPEEVADLWQLAHRVGPRLEAHHGADSLTITIQDGPAAGQSIPHVHIHLVPRKFNDYTENDKVYEDIDASSRGMVEAPPPSGKPLDLDQERVARTPDEMAAEAAELRALFKDAA